MFEYLICQAQEGRITIVNGEYVGRFMGVQSVGEVRERMFDSCPEFCTFFAKLGAEGWELVCGYNIVNEHAQYEKLIFKRPL
jgi:hypothetical protein